MYQNAEKLKMESIANAFGDENLVLYLHNKAPCHKGRHIDEGFKTQSRCICRLEYDFKIKRCYFNLDRLTKLIN